MDTTSEHDVVAGIITEFTEAFAFSRSRWARFAGEVSPELSSMSVVVLQIVFRKGPITATEIGQFLDMDKSLVSRHVSRLRELGLVAATEAPEDRRVQLLTASEHAEQLLGGVRERWALAYRERFAGWSDADLETLRAGLHRFNESAEGGHEGPASRCTRHAAEGATRA